MNIESIQVKEVERTLFGRVFLLFDIQEDETIQTKVTVSGDGMNIEVVDEADLMTFTGLNRKYIKFVCAIVWRMVYDSKKPDFDKYNY